MNNEPVYHELLSMSRLNTMSSDKLSITERKVGKQWNEDYKIGTLKKKKDQFPVCWKWNTLVYTIRQSDCKTNDLHLERCFAKSLNTTTFHNYKDL